MVISTPLLSIIKYSFLGLVVTGAGFLIANTAVSIRYESQKMEHLSYRAQRFPRNASISFHRNSFFCLTEPRRPFCLMSPKKRLKLLRNRHPSLNANRLSDAVTASIKPNHPLYLLMKDFVEMANSTGVSPVLLEPSILFCLLSTMQKYLVISNNLQTKTLTGSTHSITFGIFERDSKVLTGEGSIKKYEELGFDFSRSRKQLYNKEEFVDISFSFSRQNLTVTVIVFFQKETFVWHPAPFDNESPFQPLQFSSNQAFENLTAVPFLFEDGRHSGFHLPSELNHFLLQLQRSEFEECRQLPVTEDVLTSHPILSHDQLNQRALIAIQELKAVFSPMLVNFWLWNETSSGLEKNCDIFRTTSELHIAVAVSVSAVPKIGLNTTFTENEYLQQIGYFKWDDIHLGLTLDCFGLRIRVTVMYEDHVSRWNYEKDSTGDLIKNYHSKLRICSTSVLGQLVHKPCSNQTIS